MTTRKPMSKKLQSMLASRAAYALDCVENATSNRRIQTALELCETQERQHRAMGARFTHGQARYRVPVKVASTLMMARSFFREAPDANQPDSLADLAGMRDDHLNMLLARADARRCEARHGSDIIGLAERRMNDAGDRLLKALHAAGYMSVMDAVADWDYALDAADNA